MKKPWLARCCHWHDELTKATNIGAQIAIAVIVFCFLYEVASRYIFNAPTWWASEMVSYALCISTFSIMPQLTKMHAHVAITVIVERLSPNRQVPVYWAIYVVCFCICAIATWISLGENIRQFTQDVRLMKNEPIPKWWISIFITYGFASSTLYFLRVLSPQRIRGAISAKPLNIS